MKPRPLYRWKSFWFGVLIIVFLVWGWIRSSTHADYLSWKQGNLALGAGQLGGQLNFWHDNWEALVPSGFDAGSNPNRQR